MKKLLVTSVCVSLVLAGLSFAKTNRPQNARFGAPASLGSAAADTFILGDFRFQTGGTPTTQGWVGVDLTAQLQPFFHVDGLPASGGTMDGGTFGNLVPLGGSKSVWCGQPPSPAVPFCGYAVLPGYGNGWDQGWSSAPVSGDSLTLSYDVFWDSEGGYDGTQAQYTFDGGATWLDFAVTDTLSVRSGYYDATGAPGGTSESFTVWGPGGTNNIMIRFRFRSGDTRSDEDGLWATDGAVIIDNINLEYFSAGVSVGSNFEDFETAAIGATGAGIWTATVTAPFGDFSSLYPGLSLLQEDPCRAIFDFVWGFFDVPGNTNYSCHTPDPRPDVGAVPFGNAEGLYMNNEIWSPVMSNTGSGREYRLSFDVYKDLPLDNLQFFKWRVRTWTAGCPSPWRDHGFVYYGKHRFWGTAFTEGLDNPGAGNPIFIEPVGDLIDASASSVQVAIGVVDMCPVWCATFGGFGSGACHSQAPLIDNVKLVRVGVPGPQYRVRHLDLFQDNFAGDGTLTGKARADAAIDIAPANSPTILPGDSVAINVAPVGPDVKSGTGPAVYCYVAVWPPGQPAKALANIEAQEMRAGVGKRWPLVDSLTVGGVKWAQFRMDSVVEASRTVPDRYCFDLNDAVFTPGDTICYFFCADDGVGNLRYWTRSQMGQASDLVTSNINWAITNRLEFTILPAGGFNRGGDILYVDVSDDRGGPPQIFFDSSFDLMGMRDLVDRYDVLAPSSLAGNSLASRVTNTLVQIVDVYKNIIWCTGNLELGLLGDGTGQPRKEDDFGLLFQFLDTSTMNPGLYLSGGNIATEWVSLAGAGAAALRSTYMNFNVVDGSHVTHGEPVSPQINATGAAFSHLGVGDSLVVFGFCPILNDFDVLQPIGPAIIQFPYPLSGDGAVVSQQTVNSSDSIARVLLSGFSFNYIRDNPAADQLTERAEHLRDILIFFGNSPNVITGIDPGGVPRLANHLEGNYPNPFNPTTIIRYGVKERAHVTLNVYNVGGQLVKTLVNEVKAPAAEYKAAWDGDNNAGQRVASGVYFYRLVTRNFSQTRKMVLLK